VTELRSTVRARCYGIRGNPTGGNVCREWVTYFAGDRFGGLPTRVKAGTVNDAVGKTVCEIDVVAVGHAETGRPPLLMMGEAKWNETMGGSHLARLSRVLDLVRDTGKYDTSRTRLVCFSGSGFSADLAEAARRGEVDLVGLADLCGQLRVDL